MTALINNKLMLSYVFHSCFNHRCRYFFLSAYSVMQLLSHLIGGIVVRILCGTAFDFVDVLHLYGIVLAYLYCMHAYFDYNSLTKQLL